MIFGYPELAVPLLLTIGAYQTTTHLADLLRQVRGGQGFTITQRGEPVADLLPAGATARHAGVATALQMQRFIAEAPAAPIATLLRCFKRGATDALCA